MDKNGVADKSPKQYTIGGVVIAEHFTPEQQQTVKAITQIQRRLRVQSRRHTYDRNGTRCLQTKQDVNRSIVRDQSGNHTTESSRHYGRAKKTIEQGLMKPTPEVSDP